MRIRRYLSQWQEQFHDYRLLKAMVKVGAAFVALLVLPVAHAQRRGASAPRSVAPASAARTATATANHSGLAGGTSRLGPAGRLAGTHTATGGVHTTGVHSEGAHPASVHPADVPTAGGG